jgi:hypothetical protein
MSYERFSLKAVASEQAAKREFASKLHALIDWAIDAAIDEAHEGLDYPHLSGVSACETD